MIHLQRKKKGAFIPNIYTTLVLVRKSMNITTTTYTSYYMIQKQPQLLPCSIVLTTSPSTTMSPKKIKQKEAGTITLSPTTNFPE